MKTWRPIYQRLIYLCIICTSRRISWLHGLNNDLLCSRFHVRSTCDCLKNWLWFRLHKLSPTSYQLKLCKYRLTWVGCALRNGISLLIEAAWCNFRAWTRTWWPYIICSHLTVLILELKKWARSLCFYCHTIFVYGMNVVKFICCEQIHFNTFDNEH